MTSDHVSIPRTCPGEIYRVRVAAKRLVISVSVLKAMKSSGIYEVNHLLPTRAGFHELDLRAFTRKLLALASDPKARCIQGKQATHVPALSSPPQGSACDPVQNSRRARNPEQIGRA